MSYLNVLKELRTKREMNPVEISDVELDYVIEHLVYAASGRNAQILRYVIINDKRKEEVFNLTNLPSNHNISLEQQPSAYIIIGTQTKMPQSNMLGLDMGIAVQIIREALYELEYNSVCINAILDRDKLKEVIAIEDFYPENVIAIGKSNMKVNVVVNKERVGTSKENGVHTVYKLDKDTLIKK